VTWLSSFFLQNEAINSSLVTDLRIAYDVNQRTDQYDACITKILGTAMTICDIPCTVNKPLHQTSFPENTNAGFQVLEFTVSAGIFFTSKTLWKLRLQIELFVLWRLHLPVATVNLLTFHGSPE